MHDEQVTKELEPIPDAVGDEPKTNSGRLLSKVFIVVLLGLIAGSLTAGYYYFSIKSTPEYSLALLLDAARTGDQDEIQKYVDTDAMVDDFVIQVLDEAADLYGRGMPTGLVKRLAEASGVIGPAIKGRVAAELPAVLDSELSELSTLPFWAIVLGVDRYAVVTVEGDRAVVRSKDDTDPRQIVMVRSGNVWKIVAVKDTALAREVASAFGNEIMAIAKDGDLSGLADMFGVKGLGDLLDRINRFLNK